VAATDGVKSTSKEESMAGPDEEIAGLPGYMTQANIVGPAVGPTGSAGYLFDGTASLEGGMEEAKAFNAKDKKASESLSTFVHDTAFGFDGYTNTAKSHGHDYLATDDRAAAGIRAIATVTQQRI
jgi:hypothetical protein